MEPVNIHIATQSKYLKFFLFLIRLFDAEYSIDRVKKKDLKSVIEQGEKDFAEGKGKSFTMDELRAFIGNEVTES